MASLDDFEAATQAAVEAFFRSLRERQAARPRKTPQRPPAVPTVPVSDLARARARRGLVAAGIVVPETPVTTKR